MKKFITISVIIIALVVLGLCKTYNVEQYYNVYIESKEIIDGKCFVHTKIIEKDEAKTFSADRDNYNNIRIGKKAKIIVKGVRIPFTIICQTIEEVYEY